MLNVKTQRWIKRMKKKEKKKKAIKIRDRDICVDYLDSDLGFITFNGERKRIVQSSL